MEVTVVAATDGSLTPTEVAGEVGGEVVKVGGERHPSLLDWAVEQARAGGALGRRLLLAPGDLGLVLRLLLQAVCREQTGSGEHVVSDLIELELVVARVRGAGAWPEGGDGVVATAAARYRPFLKSSNLLDRWEVMALAAREPRHLLLWGLQGEEVEQVAGLVPTLTMVTVAGGRLATSTAPTAGLAAAPLARPGADLAPLAPLAAFLRVLVSPRDELALARAATASHLLSAGEFAEVRREAEREGLPMFPAIVSFVRRVGLGGRSYQPQEGNGLFRFLPALVELNRIVEKLQTKLEEVEGAEAAVAAVLGCLLAWLEKQGARVEEELQEVVLGLVGDTMARMVGLEATPAKGRLGRPAVKLLTWLVDRLSTSSPAADAPPGRTPSRQKALASFLRTPQAEAALDPEDAVDAMVGEAGLAERLGAGAGPGTPLARPAYPRFRTATDFTEGSPALARSADRAARTAGRTLVATSAPDTPDSSDASVRQILREVRSREEGEEQEEEQPAKRAKKATKRCLAKDVEAAAREKMGLEALGKEGEDNKEKKKKPVVKKKKFSTPKGQKKMTSFFMR